MSLLNIKKLAAALTVACSLAFASSASAAILAIGDDYYLGSIDNGIPASQENETNWVNQLATMTNGTSEAAAPAETLFRFDNGFGDLPSTLTLSFEKFEEDDLENPFTLGSGAIYVLGKYGAGAGAQISHVWYVAALAGTEITLPNDALSHISVWSGSVSVPDSASTLLLIGLGLTSLGFVARRRKA